MQSRLNYHTVIPEGMKALGGVHQYVANCGLPRILTELVYLRVSQINGCAFCIDTHIAALLEEGMEQTKINLVSVWDEMGELFSEREQAALEWAETVTYVDDTHVPEEAFENVREVFDEKEVADLTMAIGIMGAYNRMAVSFRTVPKSVR
ncbi:carboxymuconolactone decarboxylase family protein [Altericroceibacterium spongiae]|uniref:Carboxymuconolactone decarboxylase family protein n=1 Tax=Altericroceibacterium spongiae TaxID=2320269 RepID=A0A420EF04_9SPHN|nr:carboxymuconolactone decarboxylase family protein [Altericroceibacterium spongiae]RKF19285.1 carboxymuconolactone decarboxylase family protein [Altericroceibacterium spongiae]